MENEKAMEIDDIRMVVDLLASCEAQGLEMDDKMSYEVLHKMQENLAHLINRSNRYHILARTIKDEEKSLAIPDNKSSEGGARSASSASATTTATSDTIHAQMQALMKEEGELIAQEQEILAQESLIDQMENEYWNLVNGRESKIREIREVRESHVEHTRGFNARLDILKKTNIFDDAFFIWHDGEFGTINNLRLGYLTEIPIEWSEINSAWGLSALLLSSLARHIGFSFRDYRIIPMGSFTQVALAGNENSTKYPLHDSGSYFKGGFNTAMMYFLCCLKEFGDMAETADRTFILPYQIHKKGEFIGGLSIKYGNDYARWTRALKYTLTDLRYLIAFLQRTN